MRRCAPTSWTSSGRAGRRPVRLLHRQRAPDGNAAAVGPDAPVRRHPPGQGPGQGHRAGPGQGHSLRARHLAVTQIAAILTEEGTRSPRKPSGRSATPRACPGCVATTPPPRPGGGGAGRAPPWAAGGRRHGAAVRSRRAAAAGPAMTELRLHELIAESGYRPPASCRPGTRSARCCWRGQPGARAHHIDKITDDEGLAFFLGPRPAQGHPPVHLPTGPAASPASRCSPGSSASCGPSAWPAAGTASTATSTPSATRQRPGAGRAHVPARSQRTARCSPSSPATTPPARWLRQRRYHQGRAGRRDHRLRRLLEGRHRHRPRPAGLRLQLTTYKILDELSGRNITWLTLRQRGKAELARLAALPASAWTRATIKRAGRYRHPHLHEDTVTSRASARRSPGRHPQHRPRPAHPADHQRPRHAGQRPIRPVRRADAHRERAGRLHLRVRPQRATIRRLAQRRPRHYPHRRRRQPVPPVRTQAPRYENATPDTIWRHFLDATGTLHITETGVTCALNLRNHHPVLIDAGFADLEIPIPWWHGRPLRFRFPPR